MTTTTHLPDAIRAISALSELFHSGDTAAQEAALSAFQGGRESYWSKAGYSNQRACRLVLAANRAGLSAAIRECANDSASSYAARAPYLLGTLVPLNKLAMVALEAAWAEHSDAPALQAAE